MKMQNMEMEYVSFDTRDVIATSTPAVDSYVSFINFGDGQTLDNAITFSGTPYTYTDQDTFLKDLNSAFNTDSIFGNTYICTGDAMFGEKFDVSVDSIYLALNSYDAPYYDGLNGTWKWINDTFVKQ